METSTSMLQVAAMQGMIPIQRIKGCCQLVVQLAVDISLNHGDMYSLQNRILDMCISVTSGYLTLQTKALLVLQPQQECLH